MIPRLVRPSALPPVGLTVALWIALSCWLLSAGPDDGIAWRPILPVIGSAALALAVRRLLRSLDAPHADRAAALTLFVPTVLFDSQGDALSVAACVMALCAALDRRYAALLGWFVLSLALSWQALTLAPLVVAMLVNRRVSWRLWGVAPGVGAALLLLTWYAARLQGDSPAALSDGAPNAWAIAQALPWIGELPLTGLALAATIGAVAAFIAWFSVRPLHGRALVKAALLCALVTAGLAPWMTERAFLLADVLALGLALTLRGPLPLRTAALVLCGSLLALLGHYAHSNLAAMAAVPMIAASVLLARAVLAPAANDNPLMARAA